MRLAKISHNDTVDGVGICVSLWTIGCDIRCPGCHNKETWDPNGGYEKPINDVIDEIITSIKKNGVKRNFSILGGEPLTKYNRHNVSVIVNRVREAYPDIKIFLWTGHIYEKLLEENDPDLNNIFSKINVLVDGPFILEQRDISLPLRGSKNQRVLELNC